MKENIKKFILRIIQNEDFAEAISCEDYEDAYGILSMLYQENDHYPNTFSLFDELNEAINEKNRKRLREILEKCNILFTIYNVLRLVEFELLVEEEKHIQVEEGKRIKDYILEPESGYTKTLFYLRKRNFIDEEFLKKTMSYMIRHRSDTYDVEKSLDFVFSMTDEIDEDIIGKFIQGLLIAQEITPIKLMRDIYNENNKGVMEKMVIIRALREKYKTLKQAEIDNLEAKLERLKDGKLY